MTVYFHEEDLPEGVLGSGAVAIDTETMGLNPQRDRLCLVQISDGSRTQHALGQIFFVEMDAHPPALGEAAVPLNDWFSRT